MTFDSSFYNKLQELHQKKFDWKTNNCGLFVAEIYKAIYNRDFANMFAGDYYDKESAYKYVETKGGWDNILKSAGLSKREDGTILIGDVVLCEEAIGIFDGTNAIFAGKAFRRRNKITDAYYL
jgi:hypothetical protein